MLLHLTKQTVVSDKTHCKPFDEVKTNQWVCALTLRFVRITIESILRRLLIHLLHRLLHLLHRLAVLCINQCLDIVSQSVCF